MLIFDAKSEYTAFYTNAPTSDPTNTPTSDPKNTPTSDPTNSPTADPTESPSLEPTGNPTNSPTNPSCTNININIVNFNGISANQLSGDPVLQGDMSNVTRYAIADVSSAEGIGHGAFNVIYDDVAGSDDLIDGQLQRSLTIEQLLCVFDGDEFQDMFLFINQREDEISAALANRLIALYPDEDGMEVFVALTQQFSEWILCTKYKIIVSQRSFSLLLCFTCN